MEWTLPTLLNAAATDLACGLAAGWGNPFSSIFAVSSADICLISGPLQMPHLADALEWFNKFDVDAHYAECDRIHIFPVRRRMAVSGRIALARFVRQPQCKAMTRSLFRPTSRDDQHALNNIAGSGRP